MSRFDPEFYRLYRPEYPASLFDGLIHELASSPNPLVITDIGCGTGLSILSLAKAWGSHASRASWFGIDPDPKMLEQAELTLSSKGIHVELRTGRAEETGLDSASVSAILVGSAFHWMDAEQARKEFLRILKDRSALLVFEYQFPKSLTDRDLNEWIRRRFNEEWRAPGQTPRGDFKQVTRLLRDEPALQVLQQDRVPMILELGAEELAGLILSQSRTMHYENTLSTAERDHFRVSLRMELDRRMGDARQQFDFYLSRLLLRRRHS